MNIADAEHHMREIMRASQEMAPLGRAIFHVQLFVAKNWVLFTIAMLLWFVLHLHASWTNLRDNRGVDRLTWIFTIWAVPGGVMFYWLLGREDSGPSSTFKRVNVSPPAPPRTEQSTASAVSAALEKETRSRRKG